MIGIYLNDKSYEQDIRELLMAFYPGETYSYEIGMETYLKGVVNETMDQFVMELVDGHRDKQVSEVIHVNYGDKKEGKNEIKRSLYRLLTEVHQRTMPWGSLTGIRPTKIPITKLEEGMEPQEIKEFMRKFYYTSEEKVDLSLEIASNEREILSEIDYKNGYSLYIGIPFCPTTCLYCSFTSFPIGKWKKRTGEYLDALFCELDYVAKKLKGKLPDTIYIGGGTPTSLSSEDLEALFLKLESMFDLKQINEITVEAGRPDSITKEKLQVLKRHGTTRISINPQTMNDRTLELIGRKHSVEDIKTCFYQAREVGFDNINMDLIIGLPDEGMEEVTHTLKQIKQLDPESITVHSLAIKRAARLNINREEYKNMSFTNTAQMIDLTAACARELGMMPYYLYRQKNIAGNFENVGYAKKGKACAYNILIMEEKQTIIGCGAGTTTKVVYQNENRIERVENVKDVEQYMGRLEEMLARKSTLL